MTTILTIVAIILVLGILYYNKLIRKKNQVDNATGSINSMLKTRYDLIPNLVDTVKVYMTYETDTLNKLTTMRIMALDNKTLDNDKLQLDQEISTAMRKVLVSVENYPELKASQNFLQLQESWRDVEDRISASRRFYNNAVTEYNIAIKSFPQNIVASLMQYSPKQIFEITHEEAQNLQAKKLF